MIRVPSDLVLTPAVVRRAVRDWTAAERAELAATLVHPLAPRALDAEQRWWLAQFAAHGLSWSGYERLIARLRDLQAWLQPEPAE